jgi:hypothetical protein
MEHQEKEKYKSEEKVRNQSHMSKNNTSEHDDQSVSETTLSNTYTLIYGDSQTFVNDDFQKALIEIYYSQQRKRELEYGGKKDCKLLSIASMVAFKQAKTGGVEHRNIPYEKLAYKVTFPKTVNIQEIINMIRKVGDYAVDRIAYHQLQ